MKSKTKKDIIQRLKAKYNKPKDQDLFKNDAIGQEKLRLNYQNEVANFNFQTEFGELDKEAFDTKFNLKDQTIGYLKQKIDFYNLIKLHNFINDVDNKRYLEAKPEYEKLFDGFKNAENSTKFIEENSQVLAEAYDVARMFKPLIDKNTHGKSLSGVKIKGSNLSHQPQSTNLTPKVSEYIRWGYDPSVDNKVNTPKGYKYWVDQDTPMIVNGIGVVDNGE